MLLNSAVYRRDLISLTFRKSNKKIHNFPALFLQFLGGKKRDCNGLGNEAKMLG